jgi:hypothetical protein
MKETGDWGTSFRLGPLRKDLVEIEAAEEVACGLGGGAIGVDDVEVMVVVGKVIRVRGR